MLAVEVPLLRSKDPSRQITGLKRIAGYRTESKAVQDQWVLMSELELLHDVLAWLVVVFVKYFLPKKGVCVCVSRHKVLLCVLWPPESDIPVSGLRHEAEASTCKHRKTTRALDPGPMRSPKSDTSFRGQINSLLSTGCKQQASTFILMARYGQHFKGDKHAI